MQHIGEISSTIFQGFSKSSVLVARQRWPDCAYLRYALARNSKPAAIL
ncbi:hypothetical protein MIZ03_3759 [Rhodoferax lithotrophicus]|uniref:Uncharacterized protein n=1 Tax=Rhodoferax lithotrophicus TaxID=2798804 RepID=A0ABN6DD45_9BURK|nr:hypothetical protein MIZ03_3759 [Rhodoferax sp. MIZ03]